MPSKAGVGMFGQHFSPQLVRYVPEGQTLCLEPT